MKTTILPGFHDSLLTRLVERLAHGQSPVDGFVIAETHDAARTDQSADVGDTPDKAAEAAAAPMRWISIL
jgi:hypothetical protein